MGRLDWLRKQAHGLGLQVDTWAPGDGKRRYRFLDAGAHSLGQVLGMKNAEVWMDAYIAGYRAGKNDAEKVGLNSAEYWLDEFLNAERYAEEKRNESGFYKSKLEG